MTKVEFPDFRHLLTNAFNRMIEQLGATLRVRSRRVTNVASLIKVVRQPTERNRPSELHMLVLGQRLRNLSLCAVEVDKIRTQMHEY